MSVKLGELTKYLNELLHAEPLDDVSVNGLQFPGKEEIQKIAVAADATSATIQAACERCCDFLFAHHGLFWTYRKEGAIDTIQKARLKMLMDADLSIFASHIPLDMHPEVGNNAQIVRLLELINPRPIGKHGKHFIGLAADLKEEQSLDRVLAKVKETIWDEARAWKFHSNPVKRIGIITGQGQSGLEEAASAGFDTFLTGEMNHYMHPVAQDLGINIILAGHYKTEVHGPIAVGEHLKKRFGLPYEFLDFPTGL